MAIYKICNVCGNQVLQYKECICKLNRRNEYKEYKKQRLQDEEERKRQEFYVDKVWLRLSELIKIKYFGMCLMCWSEGRVEASEFTHHIETLKERYDLRLTEDNLTPLCDACHKKIHSMMNKSEFKKKFIQRKLKIIIQKFKNEF